MTDKIEPYLSDKEIKSVLMISTPTLWRWRKDGTFPKATKIGKNTNRTLVMDFEDWQRHPEKWKKEQYKDNR